MNIHRTPNPHQNVHGESMVETDVVWDEGYETALADVTRLLCDDLGHKRTAQWLMQKLDHKEVV